MSERLTEEQLEIIRQSDAKYTVVANLSWDRRMLLAELDAVRKERDELASDVRLFVPGNWECGKCKFVLSVTTLNVANGTAGTTRHDREEPRYCPNDRTEMSKVSWQKHCEGLYDNLKDRIEFSAKQAEQIAQLQAEVKESVVTSDGWRRLAVRSRRTIKGRH